MIAVVDYGVGNLFSLKSSFEMIGADITVTGDADVLLDADKLVLPGVGAFSDAVAMLRKSGLDQVIIDECGKGKPLLGICLGMQMLLDKSYEYGEYTGLGLIHGAVRPIADIIPPTLKIPHIGWNTLDFPENKPKSPIFKYVGEGEFVYFVHSYSAMECDDVTATAEYGAELCVAVGRDNVYGCQFHPEKSGDTGLCILKAFCELGE